MVVVPGLKQGVESFSPEAVQLVSAATKDLMRTLLEKLSVISEHRLEPYRVSHTNTVAAYINYDLQNLESRLHQWSLS